LVGQDDNFVTIASRFNLFTFEQLSMAKPLNFPIAVKLVVMITAILLSANLVVAIKTSEIFKEVSGKREEDINRSEADAHVASINAKLETLSEKSSLLAAMLLKVSMASAGDNKEAPSNSDRALLDETFKNDHDLVSLTVYAADPAGVKIVGRLINPAYLESYKVEADYLDVLERKMSFPVAKVFSGASTLENRSMQKGVPLLTLGIPLAKDSLGKITQVVVVDIQLQTLQKAFAARSSRTQYVVDLNGRVIAHPDEEMVLSRKNLLKSKIVKTAHGSELAKGQLRYIDGKKNKQYRSAFSKASYGLIVISEAPESIILEPAKQVQIEIIFVSLIVLAVAIFVIIVFSSTLSKPIKDLVLLAKEISKGNFLISARTIVRSRDEVGLLANAFDGMVEGLKERDKVKDLSNKFLGSTVTAELLHSGMTAGVGKSLPVAIFFSDIRGFTAISETLSAEKVVQMLNEYFNEMVKVIGRNAGRVDKYIGDAIMAVWGAPKVGKDDVFSVVNACLEMRLALNELNTIRIARGEDPLMIGMGVHFGQAIAGTIGSEEKMDYTVIGDAVNMASRIEAATKAFGTDLLISEIIAEQVKDRFLLEVAGTAKVKGKAEAITMYKVRGYNIEGRARIIKTPYSDYGAADAEKIEIVV
jgi:adenylate cyclase